MGRLPPSTSLSTPVRENSSTTGTAVPIGFMLDSFIPLTPSAPERKKTVASPAFRSSFPHPPNRLAL